MATQSRLGQMQMRFQQKLQKEQDQKRKDLISPTNDGGYYRTTTTTVTTSNGSGGNGGKVRQLFEERRQRAVGFDKSYPLQPIQTSNTTTTTVTKRTSSTIDNGRAPVKGLPFSSSGMPTTTKPLLASTSTRTVTRNTLKSDANNNQDVTDFREGRQGLNGKLAGLSISSEINGNNNDHHSGGSIKLRPVKESSTASSARTVINSNTQHGDYSVPQRQSITSPVKVTKSTTLVAKKTPVQRAPAGPPADNMAECRICGRYFNEDRLEKHETICEKSKNKKRKIFDSTKHRVKGTDAESYVGKKGRSAGAAGPKVIAGVVVKPTADGKKGNWRKKHEEFIAAIRAAKEMQAHLAKGGKLSDLPPPPPSENADYIQCPHCSRRFNEAAATRHIPKCATMLHNKPKPVAAKRRF